jgi:integrase
MKHLYWRGKSLWCRYPLPGYPEMFPLKIKTTGTPTDRARCEKQGEAALASLRTKAVENRLFDIQEIEEPKIYNPKFWRLVGRYWYHHLRFKEAAKDIRFSLMHSLKKFGSKYANEIYREDIELWRNEMKLAGASVASINHRYGYLCAVYAWANTDDKLSKRIECNPTKGMKKLSGANVRTFVLTREKFERNLEYLKNGDEKHDIPPSPRFAVFYLALWETGRRPKEVARYEWEWINETVIDGQIVHAINVPPQIAKTKEYDVVPISDRLWNEISMLAYRHGFIFRNRLGERWKYWRRHKEMLERKFGADGGWIRDTRRGMVTNKCEVEGHDPEQVRGVSGHRTASIFSRYRIGNLKNRFNVVNSEFRTNSVQIEKTA